MAEIGFHALCTGALSVEAGYEVYRKVTGLGQKRNSGLTYSILAVISFKTVSLGMYTTIPSFFSGFKSTMEVIFLNAVEYC
jgi:hypothetical protein